MVSIRKVINTGILMEFFDHTVNGGYLVVMIDFVYSQPVNYELIKWVAVTDFISFRLHFS